jgi:hypothetical protein
VSCRLFINVRHSMSSACGDVVMYSYWGPIRAISLLKSPHIMCMWFGWLVVCCVMFCCIIGINLISSPCDGMWMCIINMVVEVGCLFLLFVSIVILRLGWEF